MTYDDVQARVFTLPQYSFDLGLFIYTPTHAAEMTMKPRAVAQTFEPAMLLDAKTAQQLADSLWDAGIRPRGAMGSAGQLDATEKHLLDMRRIAFGRFGEKP